MAAELVEDADSVARVPGGGATSGLAPVSTGSTGVTELVAAVEAADTAIAVLARVVSAVTLPARCGAEESAQLTRTLERLDRIASVAGLQCTLVSGLVRRAGSWAQQPGVRSFEDWRGRTSRQGLGAAKQEQAVGETLALLPSVGRAACSGDLSNGHVRAIASVMEGASEKVRERLQEREEEILRTATRTTVPELRRHLRATAASLDSDAADRVFERTRQRRYLTMTDRAGGVQVDGFLDPIAGATLRVALDAVTSKPAADDDRTSDQRRADALVLMADRVLSVGDHRYGSQVRPHISLLVREDTWLLLQHRRRAMWGHTADDGAGSPQRSGRLERVGTFGQPLDADGVGVDDAPGGQSDERSVGRGREGWAGQAGEGWVGRGGDLVGRMDRRNRTALEASGLTEEPPLAQLLDGTLVPFAALDVLACDCFGRRVVLDATGKPLNVGQGDRRFSGSLRQAILVRDRHCQWPGCTLRSSWCEVHHIQWWKDGGPTSEANGIVLCSKHHHDIHRDLIAIRPTPGGFQFLTSDGRRIGESTRLDDELLVPRRRPPRPPDDRSGSVGRDPDDRAGPDPDDRAGPDPDDRAGPDPDDRAGPDPDGGLHGESPGPTARGNGPPPTDGVPDDYEFPDGCPAVLW